MDANGNKLSAAERGMELAGVIPGGKQARGGVKVANGIGDAAGSIGRRADDVADATRTASRGIASRIGHTTPWNEMTRAQRRAFQHSYSRHAKELGLPNWSQKSAESLRQQFNNIVRHIRNNGTQTPNPPRKPFNGQSVDVNFFEATFNGVRYYYYETLDGIFISAGRAR